jgi:hypothetical protein
MSKFRVKIVQVFRVEREAIIEVEAATYDEALAKVDDGEVDKPEWSAWKDDWQLQNEDVSKIDV